MVICKILDGSLDFSYLQINRDGRLGCNERHSCMDDKEIENQ